MVGKVTLDTYHYTQNIVCSEAERTSSTDISKTTLSITKYSTSKEIAKFLYDNGLITDKKYFLLEAKLEQADKKLIPGDYTIVSTMPVPYILELITSSSQLSQPVNVVIPNGATVEQIASLLGSKELTTKEDFIYAMTHFNFDSNYSFLQDIPPNENYKYKLEGYLTPGSYTFRKDSSAEELIIAMLDLFQQNISRYSTYINGSPYSLHELLTIASLIECETNLETERPAIAGVIYNRLDADLPLEMSSSVQYFLSKRKSSLNLIDLKKESPYNTYLNKGLPIGPVCNPSESSIKATLFSQQHDYLYFVSDNSQANSHFFSSNFTDHTYRKHLYNQLNDLNFVE